MKAIGYTLRWFVIDWPLPLGRGDGAGDFLVGAGSKDSVLNRRYLNHEML